MNFYASLPATLPKRLSDLAAREDSPKDTTLPTLQFSAGNDKEKQKWLQVLFGSYVNTIPSYLPVFFSIPFFPLHCFEQQIFVQQEKGWRKDVSEAERQGGETELNQNTCGIVVQSLSHVQTLLQLHRL